MFPNLGPGRPRKDVARAGALLHLRRSQPTGAAAHPGWLARTGARTRLLRSAGPARQIPTFLTIRSLRLRRTLLLTLIVSLSLAALFAVLVFLLGDFGQLEIRILLTVLALGGFSLTGLAGGSLLERNRFRPVAYTTLAASAIALVNALLLIWEAVDLDGDAWKFPVTLMVTTVTLAHSSLLLAMYRPHPGVRLSTIGTLAFSGFTWALIMVPLWTEADPGEAFFRLLGSSVVLTVLGTIVTPLIRRATNA